MAKPSGRLSHAWTRFAFAVTLLATCPPVLMAEPTISADGEIKPKSRVIAFESEADAVRAFSGATVQRPSQKVGESGFQITFPRRPQALATVKPQWVIAAGLGDAGPPDWQLKEDDALRLLRNRGLLAKVTNVHTTESGTWVLSLEPAALEDVIASGTVHLRVTETIHSGHADFFAPNSEPIEESLEPRSGSFVRVATHGGQSSECGQSNFRLRGKYPVVFEKVPLTASFEFQTTLTLDHTLEFNDGRLEKATFDGILCYEGETGVRAQSEIQAVTGKLWDRVSRPKLVWIGWLPIVVHVKTTLGYQASASAELTAEPLVHGTTMIARRVVYPELSARSGVSGNGDRFGLQLGDAGGAAEVSAALVPRLDVILYGIAGPYIEGAVSATARWTLAASRPNGELGVSAGLGLAMEPILSGDSPGNEPFVLYRCSWAVGSDASAATCNRDFGSTDPIGFELPMRGNRPHTPRRTAVHASTQSVRAAQ